MKRFETIEIQGVECVREIRLSYGPRRSLPEIITDSEQAGRIMRRILDPLADREHFAAIYVDSRNAAVGYRIVSVGTLNSSLVHPREVFRPGVILGAAGLLIGHNHPSGDPTPSGEDLELTRRLCAAGELLGIPLLDHVVLGLDRFVSLRTTHADCFTTKAMAVPRFS